MNVFRALFFLAFSCGAFCSCKVTGQVSQKSVNAFLNDIAVRTGHAGISIYDPAAKKYLYNYNAEKNFIPSSDVKLFTLYAGMKHLGDSITAAKVFESNDGLFFQPTGDPSFLHKDFKSQPFLNYLVAAKNKRLILVPFEKDSFAKYGQGWAWDDYQEDFMPERSRFPIFGNVFEAERKGKFLISNPPSFLANQFFSDPASMVNISASFKIARDADKNIFHFVPAADEFKNQSIPFVTDETGLLFQMQLSFLADTLGNKENKFNFDSSTNFTWKKIYSRPVDSLFRPMMFNSDNFFAEQTLLMVSNERLGYMSDEQIIDTLLNTDFKDLPAKPRWVDGSGLSRYDLFSPKDFIYILNKLQSEFGFARMKRILPTGGQGTLTNYYESDAGFIYAKTGSMSNNVSLSGYLITKKNKLLIFSVIINNFDGSGKSGRRAIEKLIKSIRETN